VSLANGPVEATDPADANREIVDWLLQPVTCEDFATRYWDRNYLHVGGRGQSYYRDLYSLSDLDRSLNTFCIRPPFVRVVRDGKELSLRSLSGGGLRRAQLLEEVLAYYRDGATIVAQFLHEQDARLRAFGRKFSAALSAGVQINAYMSPNRERGLKKHFDTHDVFVMQLHGRKAWTLYERIPLAPFQGERPNPEAVEAMEDCAELVLAPGDLLYIPRGLVHKAESLETSSLHLTVGVHPMRWAQLIHSAVSELLASDPTYRAALPMGFAADPDMELRARQTLKGLWGTLSGAFWADALIDKAKSEAQHGIAPDLTGHLLDLDGLDRIEGETRVSLRKGLRWSRQDGEDVLSLEFAGKILRLPLALSLALDFILYGGAFAVSDLPPPLAKADKVTLIRKLVKEGLLAIESLEVRR
jgi:JmjC domain